MLSFKNRNFARRVNPKGGGHIQSSRATIVIDSDKILTLDEIPPLQSNPNPTHVQTFLDRVELAIGLESQSARYAFQHGKHALDYGFMYPFHEALSQQEHQYLNSEDIIAANALLQADPNAQQPLPVTGNIRPPPKPNAKLQSTRAKTKKATSADMVLEDGDDALDAVDYKIQMVRAEKEHEEKMAIWNKGKTEYFTIFKIIFPKIYNRLPSEARSAIQTDPEFREALHRTDITKLRGMILRNTASGTTVYEARFHHAKAFREYTDHGVATDPQQYKCERDKLFRQLKPYLSEAELATHAGSVGAFDYWGEIDVRWRTEFFQFKRDLRRLPVETMTFIKMEKLIQEEYQLLRANDTFKSQPMKTEYAPPVEQRDTVLAVTSTSAAHNTKRSSPNGESSTANKKAKQTKLYPPIYPHCSMCYAAGLSGDNCKRHPEGECPIYDPEFGKKRTTLRQDQP